MVLTAGARLGPYEILAPLGAGGMGEVYRARDTRLDRTVAIKVLPAELARDASRRQRLEREAKAISQLSHPHICTLHDVGREDETDFLVVAQLTKALANEWAGRGVGVNAIAPRYMRTDNTAALRADATRNRQILERIPAGRWGEPADVAGAAVFLASAASDYVHGHLLVVDGGGMGR